MSEEQSPESSFSEFSKWISLMDIAKEISKNVTSHAKLLLASFVPSSVF